MPLYEYRCSDCQKTFEMLQPYQANGFMSATCVYCQSQKTYRRISRFTPQRGGDGEFGDGNHWTQPDCEDGHCNCGDVRG